MAQQTIENLESAAAIRNKINSNFTDLYTNKCTTSHASSSTTYGVATGLVYGHVRVTAANGLNLNNGTLSLNAASTSQVGTVQLNNTLTSTSTTQALTAAQGKVLYDNKAQAYYGASAPSSSTGKNGDIYFLIS